MQAERIAFGECAERIAFGECVCGGQGVSLHILLNNLVEVFIFQPFGLPRVDGLNCGPKKESDLPPPHSPSLAVDRMHQGQMALTDTHAVESELLELLQTDVA